MIVRRLFVALLIGIALLLPTQALAAQRYSAVVAYGYVAMFDTEDAAQAHCPKDVVVWLNTRTGIRHEKGMQWSRRQLRCRCPLRVWRPTRCRTPLRAATPQVPP